MADPSAIPPSIIEKALDPNNLVAVVTLAMLYMFYRFTSTRFELEREEQKELVEHIDQLEKRIDKIEAMIEILKEK
jgi:glycerol-3-phosphate O-acyltransferase